MRDKLRLLIVASYSVQDSMVTCLLACSSIWCFISTENKVCLVICVSELFSFYYITFRLTLWKIPHDNRASKSVNIVTAEQWALQRQTPTHLLSPAKLGSLDRDELSSRENVKMKRKSSVCRLELESAQTRLLLQIFLRWHEGRIWFPV